jgi:hypothetical protein
MVRSLSGIRISRDSGVDLYGLALWRRHGATENIRAWPIFYSFEAVLIRFTLLEFAKIEKCSATFAV